MDIFGLPHESDEPDPKYRSMKLSIFGLPYCEDDANMSVVRIKKKEQIKRHKPIFSKSGCYLCWRCEVCGASGCANNNPTSLEGECSLKPTIKSSTTFVPDFSNVAVSGQLSDITHKDYSMNNKNPIWREDIDYVHIENPVIKPFLLIGNETYYPSFGNEDWLGVYETIEEAIAVAKALYETKGWSMTIVDLRKWMYWQ